MEPLTYHHWMVLTGQAPHGHQAYLSEACGLANDDEAAVQMARLLRSYARALEIKAVSSGQSGPLEGLRVMLGALKHILGTKS